LRARGLEPFVTIWHFTLPLWFSESGGFERDDAPQKFARYCAYVADKLGDLCTHFATINEPLVFATAGWLRGTWPPFKRHFIMDYVSIPSASPNPSAKTGFGPGAILLLFRVIRHLATSHVAAYDAIKKTKPALDVGIVKHTVLFHDDGMLRNRIAAWCMNWLWTHYFMRQVAHACDSIGVNYYQQKRFGAGKTLPKTDMGWEIYPQGLHQALLLFARYKKPLYVSEAGIADAADIHRASYILELVYAIERARRDGVDVRGFMYWSLIDNYEWAEGFSKRFGLVAVDYATQERRIRQSAYEYARLIKEKSDES
jgi:beta-glucosidase